MDATDRSSWHPRAPNGKGGYQDSVIPANGGPRSGGGDASGRPDAREVDMTNQATGVPSLGQESVNFVADPR